MLSFQKQDIEEYALQNLKKLDPKKYNGASIHDKPDIQNRKLSIGVEVTSCDFQQMFVWKKYYGKSLLELFRMEGINSFRYRDIEDYCTGKYAEINISDFIEEGIYRERKGKLKKLIYEEDFYSLNKQDQLYDMSGLNWKINLDDELKIKNIYPIGFFPELLVEKLKETLRKKEEKFKNYKKFKENNLYIQTFSSDRNEYRIFEQEVDFTNCCFDYIYITDFWDEENKTYIINTKKRRVE